MLNRLMPSLLIAVSLLVICQALDYVLVLISLSRAVLIALLVGILSECGICLGGIGVCSVISICSNSLVRNYRICMIWHMLTYLPCISVLRVWMVINTGGRYVPLLGGFIWIYPRLVLPLRRPGRGVLVVAVLCWVPAWVLLVHETSFAVLFVRADLQLNSAFNTNTATYVIQVLLVFLADMDDALKAGVSRHACRRKGCILCGNAFPIACIFVGGQTDVCVTFDESIH